MLTSHEVLVIANPYTAYHSLKPNQLVMDPWNHLGRDGLLV